ncbi:MAG: hypothetical protein Q8M39_03470 [Sulfuricurvum sp.]|nr:hypothetical protein [Sulfuricurvum sp.]
MKYENVLIFSKTLWEEPPRLRHQLTRLMVSQGHKVTFFEKSSFKQIATIMRNEEGVTFFRHFELLHHQLRFCNTLILFNNLIASTIIRFLTKSLKKDLIINFNYDYDFLKNLFPSTPIITIINDDFVAQGKSWMKNSISMQLQSTCNNSDIVLAVSYPLVKHLSLFNKNTNLFLPWAETEYKEPKKLNKKRNVVLFWGYIDHRINWHLITYLLNNNVSIRFIGNIESGAKANVKQLQTYKNVEFIDSMPIEKIVLDDICCSLLPYDVTVPGVDAITISNRAFQLLSYGIPLIYSSLPHLLEAPKNVIARCENSKQFKEMIDFFSESFYEIQSDISDFLDTHYAIARYNKLLTKVGEIDTE